MQFLNRSKKFVKDDSGLMSVFGIFVVLGMLIVGALAVDMSNGYRIRTHLQVAADAAAHTALYHREWHTEDEAVARAIEVFEDSLPPALVGKAVLTAEDVAFGSWNGSTKEFTVSSGSRMGVLVNAERIAEDNTGVGTQLFRLVGLNMLDVRATSIFETFFPTCFREGFVAMEAVDFQSNNHYTNGFWIHSNDYVKVSNGSTFDWGTIVSMPDHNNLEGPNLAEEKNEGLADALRDGVYAPRIINDLPEIYTALKDPTFTSDLYPIQPDFIDSKINKVTNFLNSQRIVGPDDFTPYAVHVYEGCKSSQKISFKGKADSTETKVTGTDKKTTDTTTDTTTETLEYTTYSNFVLVTNCIIEFGQGIKLTDVIIITSNAGNQSEKSINSPSELVLGDNDGCGNGGGVTLMSVNGSVSFASALEVYGSRVIAKHDISFTANADGIEGASFIAGGTISQTSNAKMGFCGSGWNNSFEAAYFRLAG